jgi:hypothetical protein
MVCRQLFLLTSILTALAGCAGMSYDKPLEAPSSPATESASIDGLPPSDAAISREEEELKKEPPRPKLNLAGFPLPYRQGYHDGCVSAENGNEQKNETRFAQDTDYRIGWLDGFALCKPKESP